MTTEHYDIAIIGAGSAGLAALGQVRKHTDHFVLINEGPYGTTCARVGCMPSKALIEVANAFHARHRLARMGILADADLPIDTAAVLRYVRQMRDGLVAGVLKQTQDLGARNIQGRAQFVAPDTLDINGRRIRANRIIIATGSRPVVPQPWRALGTRVITSDDLFEQEHLPERMAVIGLGAMGAEIAQALSRLGIHVQGFDAGQYIAGIRDTVVHQAAYDALSKEFPIHLGTLAQLKEHNGRIQVSTGSHDMLADKVVVALGRKPNVDHLGLASLGVALDKQGIPVFDPRTLQIADLPVYIAGDANADRPLLHEAADEGYIAAHNALSTQATCFERRTPLGIVFTDPNIARVGQPLAQLDPNDTVIGSVDFTRQARAHMAAKNQGAIRVYAAKSNGRLLGAELCAPSGEHLAHLLALAIQNHLTIEQLLRLPFYHPTVEEGLRSSLRDLAKQRSNTPGPDLATCDAIGSDALD